MRDQGRLQSDPFIISLVSVGVVSNRTGGPNESQFGEETAPAAVQKMTCGFAKLGLVRWHLFELSVH